LGVAIVLARGGSKGVPGKNFASIAGRPCIAWTLDAARESRHVGRVALSTDDARLAEIGHHMGAEIIDRPASLATDTSRVDDAVRHAVSAIPQVTGTPPIDSTTPIVILYGNVPVRPAGLIDRAIEQFWTSACDSVQSYSPVGKYHPWWTARVDCLGRVHPWEGLVLNQGVFRRQDLPPAYVPDGGVLVVSRRALFLEITGVEPGPHAFFGLDRRGIVNPEGSVVDIDSRIDLYVADCMVREQEQLKQSA
jgi:N-acylneuraminate cytidylyltransferase